MTPSSDIILIGAGRSPHTKQLRAQNGHPRRTFYIGEIHIRSGMRFPVNLAFVQKYFDLIVSHITAGTLLVEYKFDKFVDTKELQTLAFGSEAERQAYEEEVSQHDQEAIAAMEAKKEALQAEKDETARIARYGDGSETPDPRGELPPGGGAENAALTLAANEKHPSVIDNYGEGTDATSGGTEDEEVLVEKPLLDNLEGSHEETITSPDDVAHAAQVAYQEDHPEEVPQEEATEDEDLADEPEYHHDENESPRTSDDPNYKPLPANWQHAAKPDLLNLCTERGIDVSDMPSNKELRRRLKAYGT
jgi:hypothetical protein